MTGLIGQLFARRRRPQVSTSQVDARTAGPAAEPMVDEVSTSGTRTVSKTEAASRQLCAAIRLFFDDQDAIAVHTLACAAGEIFEKLSGKQRLVPSIKFVERTKPKGIDVRQSLGRARNFFKHADTDADVVLEFSDVMNDLVVLLASLDAAQVLRERPVEIDAYISWYFVIYLSESEADGESGRWQRHGGHVLERTVYDSMRGIRSRSRREQKRFAARLLDALMLEAKASGPAS